MQQEFRLKYEMQIRMKMVGEFTLQCLLANRVRNLGFLTN